jgi:hypothetical protein
MLGGLALRGPAEAAASLVPPETFLPGITFSSPTEGMEVLLAGEKSIGTITGGTLEYSAAGTRAGVPLVLEKRKKGFHTARQQVVTASEVALAPLARVSHVGCDFTWTLGQLAGLGAALRLALVPDSTFLAPALYVYGQPSGLPGGMAVLHADFSVVIGQYLFFPPDSPFRMGVSAGIGAIFTGIIGANAPVYSDLYLDVANLWIELNLPEMSFFLRQEAKYATGIGVNLLGRGMIMVSGFLPPLTVGVSFKS